MQIREDSQTDNNEENSQFFLDSPPGDKFANLSDSPEKNNFLNAINNPEIKKMKTQKGKLIIVCTFNINGNFFGKSKFLNAFMVAQNIDYLICLDTRHNTKRSLGQNVFAHVPKSSINVGGIVVLKNPKTKIFATVHKASDSPPHNESNLKPKKKAEIYMIQI